MDARRSNELPRLQINWIDRVCYPLYKVDKIKFLNKIWKMKNVK